MKAERGRPYRVAEVVRQVIAEMLTNGIKDPRLGFVSVMEVKMSADLRYANVYVSLYGTEQEKKSSLVALKNASGWVRTQLGKKVRLHHTPQVRFFEDSTLDRVFGLEETFRKLHETEDGEADGEE